MNSNLETFFANTARVKADVEANPELKQRIRQILATGEQTRHGNDAIYTKLQAGRLGLKRRKSMGEIELAVMADIYAPELPMSAFGVFIGEDLAPDGSVAYLVQDLGNIFPSSLRTSQIKKTLDDVAANGYSLAEPESALGTIDEGLLVLYDLDPISLNDGWEIRNGVLYGEGKFARLAAIYERFKSPDYKLNLD